MENSTQPDDLAAQLLLPFGAIEEVYNNIPELRQFVNERILACGDNQWKPLYTTWLANDKDLTQTNYADL